MSAVGQYETCEEYHQRLLERYMFKSKRQKKVRGKQRGGGASLGAFVPRDDVNRSDKRKNVDSDDGAPADARRPAA